MRYPIGAAALVCLATALTATARAATISIGAMKDVSIFQNSPNNSSGAGNGLFAGTNGNGSPRRALLAFDVAGELPPNVVITAAHLTLRLSQFAGAGGPNPPASENQTVGLHLIGSDWGEGTAQQTIPPTDSAGTQGNGAAAGAGDATWVSRRHAMEPWTTAGGDFAAAASATALVNRNVNELFQWTSADLLDDVRQWYANPATNFGWLLKNADEANSANFRAFYSRDVLTEANRPALTLTYSAVPEPTAGGLVIVVAATLAFRRMFKFS